MVINTFIDLSCVPCKKVMVGLTQRGEKVNYSLKLLRPAWEAIKHMKIWRLCQTNS